MLDGFQGERIMPSFIERTVNDQTFQLRPASLGRYEGGLLLNQVVDDESWANDTIGEVNEGGHWMQILRFSEDELTDLNFTLTSDEQAFILANAGCVVRTDDQGFVTVTWYEDDDRLEKEWRALVRAYDSPNR